jgi:very-short-patch-repair endonuclease
MAAVLACGRKGTAERDERDEGAHGGAPTPLGEGKTRTVLDHWGAALSYRSAACLWALLPATDGAVDVSVSGDGGKRKREGIRLHRCPSLLPAAVVLRDGIPVTTPKRTIADLRRVALAAGKRGIVSPKELRQAIRQASVLGLPIGEKIDHDRTRSDLERDFLRLCRRHGLPAPEVNVRVSRYLVDFLWRDQMLIVETDGYRYHRGRSAFESDRARDLALRALGYEVVRLSGRQLSDEPKRIAEVLRQRMARFP